MGSGRSELARILFGLDGFERGEIVVEGTPDQASRAPALRRSHGMAFLTEDRRDEGLMMEASIADNIALSSLPRFAAGCARMIDRTRLGDDVGKIAPRVQINARDIDRTLVKNLSGGNQQKVVIGKWLLRAAARLHPRRTDARHRRRRQDTRSTRSSTAWPRTAPAS